MTGYCSFTLLFELKSQAIMATTIQEVPSLTTALTGPLQMLEKHLLDQQIEIEAWFREEWRKTYPPFYCSVDLRNSGFKVAPVDTNLFPAGFNNLNPDFMSLCVQALQATIEQICPDVSRILLIPESHTRNIYYLENVAVLKEIFEKAGFEIRIGSLLEELKEPKEIQLPSGKKIELEPLQRKENRVGVGDFFPNLILLNHDLSGGIPEILKNLQQKVLPPLQLSWAYRLKSVHFRHYQNVSNEFSKKFNIDPWTITPLFRNCGEVNFMTGESEDCLVRYVNELLEEIQKQYDKYKIDLKPFVVVKADSGTYGMAVMMVKNGEELRNLNRKQRTHMSTIKNGKPVTNVIIQEGIYTFETKNHSVAEPVVYMIGRHVVGGFYRVHSQRGKDENLNAPGSHFEPLAFASACNVPVNKNCDHYANRFYTYGVIARLALVAAARELAAVKENKPCP
jgi:glutamate--cysteine ligase